MRRSTANPAARRSLATSSCFLLCALILALLALLVSQPGGAAESDAYSAYGDPDKAALSTVLAGDAAAEAFGQRFGLSDKELGEVIRAVRDGDRALGEEYGQTEELLTGETGLSDAEAREKVVASDYAARTSEIIAETKTEVVGIVGPRFEAELASWVDDRFSEDADELAEGLPDGAGTTTSGSSATRASSRGETCRVWTTYYRGHTRREVAVPHKAVKFDGGHRVRIRTKKGTVGWAPVKEVGPWNVRDNYWQPSRIRDRFARLPRCVPEAAAAYYWNFNGGKDQFGRTVTNPAGVDMTIAVAKRLGIAGQLKRHGKLRVYVHYPWAR